MPSDSTAPPPENGDGPPSTDPPDGSSDLLPTYLYLPEVVMLPFFWLVPLNLLVLGGAVYLDARSLKRYAVEPAGAQWHWYLSPAVLAHLGTICYRIQRRRWILKARGISVSAFQRQLEAADPPTSRVLGLLCVGQLALVGLFVVGSPLFIPGAVLNAVLTPPLVWRDLGRVRAFDGVEWGWPRYLHVVASAVPPLLFVYSLQRYEHLAYAMVVRLWTVDPESVAVDRADLSRLERFAEWLGQIA